MTLVQVKTFIIGVLKGWFTNKKTLDKITEGENGELLFDSKAIGGGETVTDEQVQTAITETITALKTE